MSEFCALGDVLAHLGVTLTAEALGHPFSRV